MKKAHIHVLYGWWRSQGIADLAVSLRRKYPHCIVTEYEWHQIDRVLYHMRNDIDLGSIPIAIGFSLGACSLTRIAKSGLEIPLMVAYDPSWLGEIFPIGGNVARTVWFHSLFYLDWFGHGKLEGPNIKRIDTWLPHMAVQHDENLHSITMKEIDKVLS